MSAAISRAMQTTAQRQPWKTAYLAAVICGGAVVITSSMAGLMAAPAALPLYVLIGLTIVVLPPVAWWYVEAPLQLAAAQLAAILAVLSAVAWWAHRRGFRVDL